MAWLDDVDKRKLKWFLLAPSPPPNTTQKTCFQTMTPMTPLTCFQTPLRWRMANFRPCAVRRSTPDMNRAKVGFWSRVGNCRRVDSSFLLPPGPQVGPARLPEDRLDTRWGTGDSCIPGGRRNTRAGLWQSSCRSRKSSDHCGREGLLICAFQIKIVNMINMGDCFHNSQSSLYRLKTAKHKQHKRSSMYYI